MPDWPLGGMQAYDGSGGDGATTKGINLTNSGVAHTKGTWTTIATTVINCHGFFVHILTNPIMQALVDIRIQNAAAPFLVENLLVSYLVNQSAANFWVPIALGPGTIIEARQQSPATSGVVAMYCTFGSGGFNVAGSHGLVRTHGAVTSTSAGTVVTPGGSNSYGTAVTIPLVRDGFSNQNTTAEPYSSLMVAMGTQGSTSRPAIAQHQMRLIVDDQIILPDMFPSAEANANDILSGGMWTTPVSLSVRAGATIKMSTRSSSASGGNIDVCIYGIV